jgi:hypothetical protein
MSYGRYDKEALLERIGKIQIERQGDLVVTKYDGRTLKAVSVSSKYEVFDIAKYLKDKIDAIESNFTISKYRFTLTRGVQYLELLSESIEIAGQKYYKSFYILNSSDKSRVLSFNSGLYCEDSNFYIISKANAAGITKKHLRGVTKAANEASEGLGGETFDEQIASIRSLAGHRVAFSKLRETIADSDAQIAHKRFDAFKNSIRWTRGLNLSSEQIRLLCTPSEKISEIGADKDFYIDALLALQTYLRIFNKQDSHVIKNESERIMKITQWAVRNAALESLGI